MKKTDQSKLAEYESAIAHNLHSFHKTGMALQKIRDERLYQATHATFEKYCWEQWDMNRRYANRLIESALIFETVSKLGPIGPKSDTIVTPTTESQARELAGLNPDDLRKVWEKVVETAPNGHITAAHIRETRQSLFGSRHEPEQGELFTLEDYRKAIKECVEATNHHHREGKHHNREKKHYRREAIRLRDEAFKKFGVQIELPFESGEEQ